MGCLTAIAALPYSSGPSDPPATYTTDAAGNVTGITRQGGLHTTLAYGDHGRPKTATTLLGSTPRLTTTFKHNARGERVVVQNSGPLAGDFPDHTLHYDETGKLLAERRTDGRACEYLYLDDTPVGFVHQAGPTGGGTATLYYFHTDTRADPVQEVRRMASASARGSAISCSVLNW